MGLLVKVWDPLVSVLQGVVLHVGFVLSLPSGHFVSCWGMWATDFKPELGSGPVCDWLCPVLVQILTGVSVLPVKNGKGSLCWFIISRPCFSAKLQSRISLSPTCFHRPSKMWLRTSTCNVLILVKQEPAERKHT